MGLDDDRYHDILKLIGDQRRDFQQFETSVLQSQSQHWKSVTTAIRTLSDWWAKHADEETAERRARQGELDRKLAALARNQIIARSVELVLIVVGLIVIAWWL